MIRWSCAAGLLAVFLCSGCRPGANPHIEKTIPVSGKVTFANGSPVRGGLVTLHPKDGTKSESRGTIDKSGNFTLGTYKVSDGTMPGEYTVTVEPIVYDKRGNMRPDKSLGIPAKYASPDSSGLTIEIKDQESQEVNLVLR